MIGHYHSVPGKLWRALVAIFCRFNWVVWLGLLGIILNLLGRIFLHGQWKLGLLHPGSNSKILLPNVGVLLPLGVLVTSQYQFM